MIIASFARERAHAALAWRRRATVSYTHLDVYKRQALREAFKKHKERLVFLDFITDRTENVWPMVKAGRGLTEMLLGSEDL